MLYQPREIINVAENIGVGFTAAALVAAGDFLAGESKPWAFYPGVALGSMAVATGIPGAAATMYVVGDTVDALLFKSPDGSDVRVFLNGVAYASLDTYAAAAVWESVNITGLVGGQVNRIDIFNYGPSADPDATGIQWLALGPITVNGTNAYALQREIAMDTLAVRITDAETDATAATLPIYLPSGSTLAEVQAYADAVLPEIDAVTGGVISEATITFTLTLPGGLKASAETGILNERGGLISFNTTGPRRDSVRIPAISRSIMAGDSFDVASGAVATLVTRLTTATTAANIQPRTVQDYQFVSALTGKKSFRK
jgi:hypothetical protein